MGRGSQNRRRLASDLTRVAACVVAALVASCVVGIGTGFLIDRIVWSE